MLRIFSISPDDTVLDAGCGYGLKSIEAAKEGAYVISIDLSRRCVEMLNSEKGTYNIAIIRADVQNLPLKDSSIDKVMCTDLLEHVPNERNALREFQRTLKKKGKIFLLVPSCISEKTYMLLDHDHQKRIGHLRTFSHNELLNLFESSGFLHNASFQVEFFRAVYHLLQILFRSKFEVQTGRVIAEDARLVTIWRISQILCYSRIGKFIEMFGKHVYPKSLIVIATKT